MWQPADPKMHLGEEGQGAAAQAALQCAAALTGGRQRREAAALIAIDIKCVPGPIWDRQAGLNGQGLPEGRIG